MPYRVAIPTKDRAGNVALAITNVAMHLKPGDELVLYDDGHRPATADYATRFALDIATQLGASVEVKRGKPAGIAAARAKILKDAHRDRVQYLRMVDDDIILTEAAWKKVWQTLTDVKDAQYAVPIIGLSNNEAGVERFGDVPEDSAVHLQQFVLNGSGVHRIKGGAWTCDIAMDLYTFDVQQAIFDLTNGPKVVEDFVLTAPLTGYVDRSALVWHVMSDAQGQRAWNSLALQYLRQQIGGSPE